MFKSGILEVGLDDGGKHDKTTDGGNWKHNVKGNLIELNKVRKQPQRCSGKKDVLINRCSESCQGKFSVKILEKYLWRSSFLVKLHNLVPGSFYLRKKLIN